MILAFDTYYYNNKAKTVCLAFRNWQDESEQSAYAEIRENQEEYTPGEFYKRELPCILNLLKIIPSENIACILIDGYVFLDDNEKPGLGAHLYTALNSTIPVIGIAKTNFATIHQSKREVLRGQSHTPLYVTAIGLDLDLAAENIRTMNGEYRIPTLLKKLDSLTRQQDQQDD